MAVQAEHQSQADGLPPPQSVEFLPMLHSLLSQTQPELSAKSSQSAKEIASGIGAIKQKIQEARHELATLSAPDQSLSEQSREMSGLERTIQQRLMVLTKLAEAARRA